MARLLPVALILALAPADAWAQPADTVQPRDWRMPTLNSFPPQFPSAAPFESRLVAGAEIAPNAGFGFGMFGLKPMARLQTSVTGHDVNAPRSRRAGIGLRVRF